MAKQKRIEDFRVLSRVAYTNGESQVVECPHCKRVFSRMVLPDRRFGYRTKPPECPKCSYPLTLLTKTRFHSSEAVVLEEDFNPSSR